jgi:hypothetical protein
MVQTMAVLTAREQIPVIVRIKAAPPNDVVQADCLAPLLHILGVPANGTAFSHQGIGF